MALNPAGYQTMGTPPGTASAIGNYVPATGANATAGGTTQYTNGTDFATYTSSVGWIISLSPNLTSPGANTYYYNTQAPNGAVNNATNFPLTFWALGNGAAPAPTFTTTGGSAPATAPRLQPRVVVF